MSRCRVVALSYLVGGEVAFGIVPYVGEQERVREVGDHHTPRHAPAQAHDRVQIQGARPPPLHGSFSRPSRQASPGQVQGAATHTRRRARVVHLPAAARDGSPSPAPSSTTVLPTALSFTPAAPTPAQWPGFGTGLGQRCADRTCAGRGGADLAAATLRWPSPHPYAAPKAGHGSERRGCWTGAADHSARPVVRPNCTPNARRLSPEAACSSSTAAGASSSDSSSEAANSAPIPPSLELSESAAAAAAEEGSGSSSGWGVSPMVCRTSRGSGPAGSGLKLQAGRGSECTR